MLLYECMYDDVAATNDLLRNEVLWKDKAEVVFACEDGVEVGFALFYHNFSTFLGRARVYFEGVFVAPRHRGKGYGKAPLRHLARIAKEMVECAQEKGPDRGLSA